MIVGARRGYPAGFQAAPDKRGPIERGSRAVSAPAQSDKTPDRSLVDAGPGEFDLFQS